jgi:CRISPR-associated protein Csd2
MSVLEKKIDFALIFSVKNANPNGDPLSGNMPRVTIDGVGEVSDVCLKRKIRDRFLESGENIFVQSDENRTDEYKTLKDRAEGVLKDATKSGDTLRKKACEIWLDVRSFGQLFAYKGVDGKKGEGVSVGIRGPVTIQSAFTVEPINTTSIQITKSVNSEPKKNQQTGESQDGMSSDRMGMKHRVDKGIYVTYGSINPQLAGKTGFSADDAQKIKQALVRIFENDASSARPEGSMAVLNVIWWEHNCKSGQYSSAKVHKSLHVKADGSYTLDTLTGLKPEEIPGF